MSDTGSDGHATSVGGGGGSDRPETSVAASHEVVAGHTRDVRVSPAPPSPREESVGANHVTVDGGVASRDRCGDGEAGQDDARTRSVRAATASASPPPPRERPDAPGLSQRGVASVGSRKPGVAKTHGAMRASEGRSQRPGIWGRTSPPPGRRRRVQRCAKTSRPFAPGAGWPLRPRRNAPAQVPHVTGAVWPSPPRAPVAARRACGHICEYLTERSPPHRGRAGRAAAGAAAKSPPNCPLHDREWDRSIPIRDGGTQRGNGGLTLSRS